MGVMSGISEGGGLTVLLAFLVVLGCVRHRLARREKRLLADLCERLQAMQREREMKKLELAKAKRNVE